VYHSVVSTTHSQVQRLNGERIGRVCAKLRTLDTTKAI